jgi:hypothetical protein
VVTCVAAPIIQLASRSRFELGRRGLRHRARHERGHLRRRADHPVGQQVEDPVADRARGFVGQTGDRACCAARGAAGAAGDFIENRTHDRQMDLARGRGLGPWLSSAHAFGVARCDAHGGRQCTGALCGTERKPRGEDRGQRAGQGHPLP